MRETKHILIEGLLLLVVGGGLALAANFLSPRGLALTRNYFPGSRRSVISPLSANTAAANVGTSTNSALDVLTARLKDKGLQVVDSNQVERIFRDPRHDQELFVFVDGRDEARYQAGHVPGAFLFDHFRAENYLAAVLPVCLTAEKIVVYCGGGNCEDSEFAAVILRDAGVPGEKLWLYPGGLAEWTTNGLPIETGTRQNGWLRPSQP